VDRLTAIGVEVVSGGAGSVIGNVAPGCCAGQGSGPGCSSSRDAGRSGRFSPTEGAGRWSPGVTWSWTHDFEDPRPLASPPRLETGGLAARALNIAGSDVESPTLTPVKLLVRSDAVSWLRSSGGDLVSAPPDTGSSGNVVPLAYVPVACLS
jgi:hypothetical protein